MTFRVLCTASLIVTSSLFANAQTAGNTPSAQPQVTKTVGDIETLKEYTGEYKFKAGDLDKLVISLKDGKLFGSVAGQGESELAPTDKKDIFTIVSYDTPVEFFRDADSKLKSLKFTIQGSEMEAEK